MRRPHAAKIDDRGLGRVMETRTILIVVAIGAWFLAVAHWKQRKDLRRAAKIFADREGREGWWTIRLRSAFVDKEHELERQRQIVKAEGEFLKYFVGRYGNPDDYDWTSHTTGEPE